MSHSTLRLKKCDRLACRKYFFQLIILQLVQITKWFKLSFFSYYWKIRRALISIACTRRRKRKLIQVTNDSTTRVSIRRASIASNHGKWWILCYRHFVSIVTRQIFKQSLTCSPCVSQFSIFLWSIRILQRGRFLFYPNFDKGLKKWGWNVREIINDHATQ